MQQRIATTIVLYVSVNAKICLSFPILEVALDVSILASLVFTYLIYILLSAVYLTTEDRQLHQLERIERI